MHAFSTLRLQDRPVCCSGFPTSRVIHRLILSVSLRETRDILLFMWNICRIIFWGVLLNGEQGPR